MGGRSGPHAGAIAVLVTAGLLAWPVGGSANGAGRAVTQTLVFDAVATGSFVDNPPPGPGPGDIELSTARLYDAGGRAVGTASSRCVFTKNTPDGDVLESCTETAKTSEGTATLSGPGYLHSMNPPWHVAGQTGAYKGVRGTQVFGVDIPLDPNVPIAAGRGFSVAVIQVHVQHRLKVGVVPRPAKNAPFIKRANAACNATVRKVQALPGFPFSSFDPFNPDPQLLPQVGQFFNQPVRRDLPSALLTKLRKLGAPPARRQAWQKVLAARQTQIVNERKQVNAALAGDAPAFVQTVYQESRDYNRLVFASAVFGTQTCTFG